MTTDTSASVDTDTNTSASRPAAPVGTTDTARIPGIDDAAETTPGRSRPGRRLAALAGLAIAVVGLIGIGVLLGPALDQGETGDTATETDTPDPLPTETVSRGQLVESIDTTGTVSYGDSWTVPVKAEGVVTARPDKGALVEPGGVLIEIGGKPVHLAEGSTPLYRTLTYRSAAKDRLKGEDVRQLQQFLLDAGHDDAGRLEADAEFGRSTQRAVKAWQKDVGLDQTGTVDRTQLVFHPGPVRLATVPRVGDDYQTMEATDAEQQITAQFKRDQRAFVPDGAEVTIELDGTEITGTVTAVTSTRSEDGSSGLQVRIDPTTPIPPETERVKVVASRVQAEDATIVPVRAILALASGGYGVEVATAAGPDLRRVELGPVVDDRVEVRGAIAEGDEVFVPRTVGADQ